MENETTFDSRATSTITLFHAPFSKEDNFHFGNLEAVLAKCPSKEFTGCNPIALEMKKTIRLQMPGATATETPSVYNYVRVRHYDNHGDFQNVSYWFVTAMRWSGVNVLVVDIELDTINTLVHGEDLATLMDKTTMIEREHEARWEMDKTIIDPRTGGGWNFVGIKRVDDVSEGFPTILKVKKSESKVLDKAFSTAKSASLKNTPWSVFYGRKTKSDTQFILALNPMATGLKAKLVDEEGKEGIKEVASVSDINFSYTLATKIIEYPYCPFMDVAPVTGEDDTFSFSLDGALAPIYLNLKVSGDSLYTGLLDGGVMVYYTSLIKGRSRRRLINNVKIPSYYQTAVLLNENLLSTTRRLKDSKLNHSDFYSCRFAYDIYSFEMPFEKCTFGNASAVDIYFSASLSATATFGFFFDKKGWTMQETDDFPYYLLCRRNNELPLVNDKYLDYIYNGYNYEQQAKGISLASGLERSAIGAVGASLVNPAFVPVTLASGAINAITGVIQNEVSKAQKRASLASTAIGLSGNDDVDILRDATGDKLTLFEYGLPEHLETMLDNLFYYYGYKRGYQGVPDATSRVWFNFVQCSPKWKRSVSAQPRACYDALAMRFREGVTFLHFQESLKDSDATDIVAGHNIDRTRENWEKGLIINGN